MAERVFNRMQRPVYRKHIGLAEVMGSLAVLVALTGASLWVAAQRDNFDPGERDISIEVLREQSVADRLYRRPLLTWTEPGSQAPAGGGGPALGVFPAGLLEGGWQVGTRLKTFDPDNLYVKINGAAEQYLGYGFKQLHSIGLAHTSGPETLDIELYDQGGFAGGLGIFSAQRDPAKPVLREGALSYYETSAGAIGVMGRWFFKLAGNSEGAAIQDKARQLVRVLAGLPVAEGEVPQGFRVLSEGLGVDLADIEYQPADVFQYAFARDFWFGRVTPGARARWFLHRAADGAAAAELSGQILAEHRYDYDTLRLDEDRTVMRHKFLKTVFALETRGPFLYGVENAPDEAGTDALMARLVEALPPGAE